MPVDVFPSVPVSAVVENGLLTARCPGFSRKRILTGLRVSGPAGSGVSVYLGSIGESQKIDNTPYGVNNTAEYIGVTHEVFPNQVVIVVWSTGTGVASANFFFKAGE